MHTTPFYTVCFFMGVGCTFPIKNDIDTGSGVDLLSEFATIETTYVPDCNTGNLYKRASVKDDAGIRLETNTQGSPAVLWAELGNQCEGVSLDISQKSSCMVESWEITPTGGEPLVYDFLCDDEPKEWTLQSGQLRRQQVATLTDLPAGSYFMEITFGVTESGGIRIRKSADLIVIDAEG